MSKAIAFVLICMIFASCISAESSDANIKTTYLPVPIQSDQQYRCDTEMYLAAPMEKHFVSGTSFSPREGKGAKVAFVNLMKSLEKKDNKAIKEMVFPDTGSGREESKNSMVKMHTDLLAEIVHTMRLDYQVFLGDRQLFMCTFVKDQKDLPITYDFVKYNDKFYWDILNQSPSTTLFRYVYAHGSKSALLELPEAVERYHEYSVLKDENDNQLVSLFFKAHLLDDADVFSENFGDNAEISSVLGFYADAMKTFRDRPPAEYTEFWTPRSKEKMDKWINSMTPERFLSTRQREIGNGRTLRFLVRAKPFDIVFHSTPTLGTRYDYIILTEQDDMLLTNLGFRNTLDLILSSEDFTDAVLSKLKAESEEPKDEE